MAQGLNSSISNAVLTRACRNRFLRHNRVECGCSIVLEAVCNVRIEIAGNRDGAVTQALLHHLEVLAAEQQKAGMAVAQAMEVGLR